MKTTRTDTQRAVRPRRRSVAIVLLAMTGLWSSASVDCTAEDFVWQMRSQKLEGPQGHVYERVTREETWAPETTAFIVCDVWDKHHSVNAVRRLEEFGPRLNSVLQEARRRGAVIIHSPSDCMPAYENHPARRRAVAVPRAENSPTDIEHWCSRIPAEERAAYPIDQSDGGDDDDPAEHAGWAADLTALGRNPGLPWKTQSPMIEIDGEKDFISDRGDEVWNILEQRGITNVVLTGVHTNMCVLGRPFGLRQMVRNGRNVVLMRDMTDCMYNPQRWPYVDHFTGNDLVISHVERFVCPTVTSDQMLGGKPFVFANDVRKKRDVSDVAAAVRTVESLTRDWTVVSLPATWSDVVGPSSATQRGVKWYRSTVRLTDRWLKQDELSVCVTPPATGTVRVWLNGTEATEVRQLCLACSAPEPVKFRFPAAAITRDEANLLVIRVEAEAPEKSLMAPPKLYAGTRDFELNGRWQLRAGDDPTWCNMPLPAKFGTATDIVFEPVVPPNIVLIFADDLGYGDVTSFGGKGAATPNIDQLAAEGRRFTDFYVAQAVCTASRASLMSGCYANRVSLSGALNHTSTNGIHPDELLIPEMLKQKGYATSIFGKWHLGTVPEFHPLKNGFDEYLGIPYSNDNSRFHPVVKDMPPLPLYDGEKVIAVDTDQAMFTRQFTERAVNFIETNRDKPFFLYVPHVMPHVPIFASDKFLGKSKHGLYADVIQELDWSVGEIQRAVTQCGLDENTLIIFMSDNGPFLSYGNHAGSSGDLREGKLTTFEGGVRTPCVMRWKGTIPAGTRCSEVAATIDLLPTFAAMVGGQLSDNRIDGRDISPLIRGSANAQSPHEALCFYAAGELQAVRSGDWKLHFAHQYLTVAGPPGRDGKPSNHDQLKPASILQSGIHGIASRHGYKVADLPLSLFNMRDDPGETRNVAERHPDVVLKLSHMAEPLRSQLGDEIQGVKGTAVRACGDVKEAAAKSDEVVRPVSSVRSVARPNVVVLIADDLGYGETGCQGNPDIPTPHIDAIAAAGVRFTSGYVTAAFCSASRAGLLAGRYQNRFGYENNPIGAQNSDPQIGLPLSELTMADLLHDAGYATSLVGKWHLGGTAKFHPQRRGFDEFFGFLHEGHYFVPPPYDAVTTWLRRKALPDGRHGRWSSRDGRLWLSTHLNGDEPDYDADNPILRSSQPVAESDYLTDAISREAVEFIHRTAERPFFLCVAYNAVHSPMQAMPEDMAEFAGIEDIHRRIFAAMLSSLDRGVGKVIGALRSHQLDKQTLIVFVSDNGGPTRELTSRNDPLRGGKGTLYEGGIRVPFFMQWPDQIPAGATFDPPVSSLDILPTSLAAAGVPPHDVPVLDGVDLMPFLKGDATGVPHRELYWRAGTRAAFRTGDWKIVRTNAGREWELYNLRDDISEQKDLATAESSQLDELVTRWNAWDAKMIAPLF